MKQRLLAKETKAELPADHLPTVRVIVLKILPVRSTITGTSPVRDFVTGGIELPEGAPAELLDRQTLWSRHELKDIRKDAELFRELTVALPNELDYDAAASIMQRIAKPLTDRGMCVQWDIHDTTRKGQRNLHAHMMITMRTLQPDGTFGNKNRSWNKYNGGLNIADLLRPEAARLMNEELARIGSSEKVEYESFAARGLDKIPTKHVGVAATAMERKGIETDKGNRNRYINWLNRIHADNLRQVERQTQSGNLEDLIAGARAQQGGDEAFKDWDALFAMLRDARRCRAAMNRELGKLSKVASAFEEGNEGYLRWAGCDPDSETQRLLIQTMQNELRIQIKQMDITETWLLDSKDLYKAHNRAVYTSRKVAWDQYQIDRNKRGMEYCAQRLDSINSYMRYLNRSISLYDAIFETKEYQEYRNKMNSLRAQQEKLQQAYARNRAGLQQAKQDLKEHRKDARQAKKEEKVVRKKIDQER